MFSDFLSPSVADIQDADAIALLQRLQRQVIQVPFKQRSTVMVPDRPIFCRQDSPIATATAYFHTSGKLSDVPILLLHGFDSSLLEFRYLLPLLVNHHKTWALDCYGSGFTAYNPHLAVNPHTIRQHLLGAIATLINKPVILVGASLGGAIAMDFAQHFPEWVRSLVLINSVGFSGHFPLGQFLPQPLLEIGADWLYLRKQIALNAASALSMNESVIDALRCSRLHQEMPGWKEAVSSFSQSEGYSDLCDRISHVSHPTLVVWGENDDVLGTADAVRFEQAILESQLVWIRGAGHAPHLDQPQAVAEHLLTFAQGLKNTTDVKLMD
ncbi:MAG: alpha/beta fold hydrolase [Thermosynechococcaceae cyanobacterium]